jgi:hypothetical protein
MRSLIVDRLKRLSAPVPAIPVDLFRILIGLLALGYFINLALYAREFLDPQGLVDHQLHEQTIFLSRFGIFSATAPIWQINGALALAIVCCIGTVLGVRIRPCALTAYVIAVSCFRRMFIFTYVDDTIMHLMLLWVVLLPCGETLSLRRLRLPDAQERERWLAAKVSGFVPRLVVFNACLIYLVAGLWKFTSPLWRQGLALFTILKLPAISLFPGYWREFMLLLLVPLSYLALVIEPSLPILLTRKPGSPLKWLGLISALALHLGIVATLKVPFANLAMSAVLVLFFRSELMRILGKRPAMREADKTSFPLRWPEKVSLILVTGILMISTREIPVLDPLNEPGYAVL